MSRKASEAANSEDQAIHSSRSQHETKDRATASSSAATGTYDDMRFNTSTSIPSADIFDSSWTQVESSEKKSRYRFGATISSRSIYGTVRDADGPIGKVSVKIVGKKAFAGAAKAAVNEINILRRIEHPNIIHLIDWFESRAEYYIVMQHITGGYLLKRVCDRGKFTERDAASMMLQILRAVLYLHENLIIHHNITPEHIYCISPDVDSPVVLACFDQSTILSSPEEVCTDLLGTFGYAAPEVMTKEGHGLPADVWSIGVVAYVLLCGYFPFRSTNMKDLYKECTQTGVVFHQGYWNDVSSDAKDFISQLLIPDVQSRFTCQVCPTKNC
ncbi:Calcium/calmodulin dependent protein kinase [Trichoderma citrinoviride]|uniref:Calcium/calmodulin dependent protein kinase n=1 Tax=Trichoderma citrinoviride TaxID=58853 RepID=A0A2T4AXT5_9HYPO|nr:Calcium/calmodulin dependent protein kinase [Trichoderma citrinoviride]PTB61873.1 Calcium/calmodulin dependent protein kinase [Trichoderma citrinoviride]